MSVTIATDRQTIVVGLGLTGLSCVRYLSRKGRSVMVMDSREQAPGLAELNAEFPNVRAMCGGFDRELLCKADEIILSPGVSLKQEDIAAAVDAGVRVRGDIDLFAEAAAAPVIAITGSNGKSTVTTLVGQMAKLSGINVGVGGNIGTPALDLLEPAKALYVLELSSFQLETTASLNAKCVTLLNVSEDHMDRYSTRLEYLQAKQRIFRGAEYVVVNDDDPLTLPLVSQQMKLFHYGLASTDINKVSVQSSPQGEYIVKGFEPVLAVKELGLKGRHNLNNALAAFSIGFAMGFKTDAMISVAKSFSGLPHRCQWVRTLNDVDFINDSKGTNPGATSAAIEGFSHVGARNIVLIAGGDAKGADMTPLANQMSMHGKQAILIGRDANVMAEVLSPVVPTEMAKDMKDAVIKASSVALAGDVVLLSPSCASFDMFDNFEHRGHVFSEEVMAL